MTEKFKLVKTEPYIENIETGECYDLDSDNFSYIVKVMNDLSNENEQLKQIFNELSVIIQFDIENGIKSYPVKELNEYLNDALKGLIK